MIILLRNRLYELESLLGRFLNLNLHWNLHFFWSLWDYSLLLLFSSFICYCSLKYWFTTLKYNIDTKLEINLSHQLYVKPFTSKEFRLSLLYSLHYDCFRLLAKLTLTSLLQFYAHDLHQDSYVQCSSMRQSPLVLHSHDLSKIWILGQVCLSDLLSSKVGYSGRFRSY